MTHSQSGDGFEPLPLNQIPLDENGNCAQNLYVYLPGPKKFVCFVLKGERFTLTRKAALEKHSVAALFLRRDDHKSDSESIIQEHPTGAGSILDHEIMGPAAKSNLENIFHQLVNNSENQENSAVIAELEKMADDIINLVAPDVDDIKERMLENASYVWLMNDASALTTISVLFAVANGIDSRKSLRDVACACIVMDLPLIKLKEEEIETFHRDRSGVSKDFLKIYEQHPLEAFRLAKQSVRHFSETALDLILNHHELHNGRGFPRKIRSASLFPLARIFALAVDIYDSLKGAAAKNEPLSLSEALQKVRQDEHDLHLRRHNHDIIDKVEEFINAEGPGVKTKLAA